MTIQTLSRRSFIRASVAAGGGLMLGFHMPVALAASIAPRTQSTTTAVGIEINAWIVIDKDGTVTLRIPHTEQGQGGATSVAMLIAEELNVDWSNIKTEFADANRHLRNNKEYKVMSTHGSQLVRLQHPHLMGAGASARERLKQAAAEAWGVDRSEIEAKLGVLTAGNRTATYGEFAVGGGQSEARQGAGDRDRPGQVVAARQAEATAGHPQQGQRQRAIRDRYPRARHGLCRGQSEPGAVGDAEELRFRRHQGPSGRARGRATQGRSGQARTAGYAGRRRSGRGQLVSRQNGTRAAPDRMGVRRKRQYQLCGVRRGGPQIGRSKGNFERQRRFDGRRDHRLRQEARDRNLRSPIRDACPDGADQRDRPCAARSRGRVVADAGSISGDYPGCRPAWRRSEDRLRAHHVPRRQLRGQRRRRYGGHAPGGRNIAADRQAREGHMVTRGRYRAGQAAPADRCQAHRGNRR